jgi:hypothetical protein
LHADIAHGKHVDAAVLLDRQPQPATLS